MSPSPLKLWHLAAALFLHLCAAPAQAALTCNATATAVSTGPAKRDFCHEFLAAEPVKTAQYGAIHDTATRRYHHHVENRRAGKGQCDVTESIDECL
jgi:hypothetical protein